MSDEDPVDVNFRQRESIAAAQPKYREVRGRPGGWTLRIAYSTGPAPIIRHGSPDSEWISPLTELVHRAVGRARFLHRERSEASDPYVLLTLLHLQEGGCGCCDRPLTVDDIRLQQVHGHRDDEVMVEVSPLLTITRATIGFVPLFVHPYRIHGRLVHRTCGRSYASTLLFHQWTTALGHLRRESSALRDLETKLTHLLSTLGGRSSSANAQRPVCLVTAEEQHALAALRASSDGMANDIRRIERALDAKWTVDADALSEDRESLSPFSTNTSGAAIELLALCHRCWTWKGVTAFRWRKYYPPGWVLCHEDVALRCLACSTRSGAKDATSPANDPAGAIATHSVNASIPSSGGTFARAPCSGLPTSSFTVNTLNSGGATPPSAGSSGSERNNDEETRGATEEDATEDETDEDSPSLFPLTLSSIEDLTFPHEAAGSSSSHSSSSTPSLSSPSAGPGRSGAEAASGTPTMAPPQGAFQALKSALRDELEFQRTMETRWRAYRNEHADSIEVERIHFDREREQVEREWQTRWSQWIRRCSRVSPTRRDEVRAEAERWFPRLLPIPTFWTLPWADWLRSSTVRASTSSRHLPSSQEASRRSSHGGPSSSGTSNRSSRPVRSSREHLSPRGRRSANGSLSQSSRRVVPPWVHAKRGRGR